MYVRSRILFSNNRKQKIYFLHDVLIKEISMKSRTPILLLLTVIVFISGCSLPPKLPTDGVWYNEELDVSLEFAMVPDFDLPMIVNIVWNSKSNYLHVFLNYGNEIAFYVIDENGSKVCLLNGYFKYSKDKFIVSAYEIAQPFDISGELVEVDDETFVFTRCPATS